MQHLLLIKVDVVVKHLAIGGRGLGLITEPVRLDAESLTGGLAIAATFHQSCVAQGLSRGDGPRLSLHASAS